MPKHNSRGCVEFVRKSCGDIYLLSKYENMHIVLLICRGIHSTVPCTDSLNVNVSSRHTIHRVPAVSPVHVFSLMYSLLVHSIYMNRA